MMNNDYQKKYYNNILVFTMNSKHYSDDNKKNDTILLGKTLMILKIRTINIAMMKKQTNKQKKQE